MLELTADTRVGNAVGALGHALEAGDIGRAVDLFQDDCYWRDLVAFTWNITTMEGKDAVRAMLEAQLAGIDTSNWAIDPAAPPPRTERSPPAPSPSKPAPSAATA